MKRIAIYLSALMIIAMGLTAEAQKKGRGKKTKEPLTEEKYESKKDKLRARASFASKDESLARSQATTLARTELAASISDVILRVRNLYRQQQGLDVQTMLKDDNNSIVQANVKYAPVLETEMYSYKEKKTKDWVYTSYVVVEYSTEEVLRIAEKNITEMLE